MYCTTAVGLSISVTLTDYVTPITNNYLKINKTEVRRLSVSISHTLQTLITTAAAKYCVAATREWSGVAFAGPGSQAACCYGSIRGLVACIYGQLWRPTQQQQQQRRLPVIWYQQTTGTCSASLNHRTHQCYLQQSRHVHARPTYNIQHLELYMCAHQLVNEWLSSVCMRSDAIKPCSSKHDTLLHW